MSGRTLCAPGPARIWSAGVDVRVPAALSWLHVIPDRRRPLGLKLYLNDRLHGLQAVLPWSNETNRRSILFRKRRALNAGHQQCQLVPRLDEAQSFEVWPGIILLAADAAHLIRAARSHHSHEFRFRHRVHFLDQGGIGKPVQETAQALLPRPGGRRARDDARTVRLTPPGSARSGRYDK